MKTSLLNLNSISFILHPSSFIFALPLCLLSLAAGAACSSVKETDAENTSSIIIVNAPAAGEVRRVLVTEGAKVEAGAPVVEIAVQEQTPTCAPSPGESAESQALRSIKATQSEIEATRAEVVRHEAEVQRLTPLVASGEASQAQLDGERALYDRAQQRLQQAKDAERRAGSNLLAARQPGTQAGATPNTFQIKTVFARASSAGKVRVISTRVGDRVTSGQPLATLRSDEP